MKVGNIMAENASLMSLAQTVTPAASPNTGFDQCMQKSLTQQKDMMAQPVAKVKDGVIVSDTVKTDVAENQQTTDADMAMTDTTAQTGMQNTDTEVSVEQLDAVNQQIKDAIRKALNLDEEAVDAILAELGIVPLDLMQTENLQQFILLADGGQEATDLLLNEQMMMDFNMLSEMLQELDFLEITDAPMAKLIQQMEMVMEPLPEWGEEMSAVLPSMMATGQDDTTDPVLTGQIAASADTSTVVENETAQTGQQLPMADENSRAILPKEDVDGSAMQTADDQPEMIVSVTETDAGADSGNQGFASGQNAEEMWDAEAQMRPSQPEEPQVEMPVFMNHSWQAVNTVREVSAPQPVTPQMVQIVEQIVEQIRVNLQSDTTSMEMQLNPESLGKVLLNVTAKAGVMTATFTVQTEEARAAIESQMYTLRENLEQKELKVDAVEVTVSNFDFTQAGNGGEDQKNMDQGDGRSRRYHVEEQDGEEAGELSAEQEAERVRQSVMRDNGSSIDFTA